MLIYFSWSWNHGHWIWPTPQQCPTCGCWPRLTPCWSQAGAGGRFGKAPAVAGTVALLGSFLWAGRSRRSVICTPKNVQKPDSNQITVWKLWNFSPNEIVCSHKHPWTACFTINRIQVRLAVTQKLTCFHQKWIGFARCLMQVKPKIASVGSIANALDLLMFQHIATLRMKSLRGFMQSLYHLSLVDLMADLSSDLQRLATSLFWNKGNSTSMMNDTERCVLRWLARKVTTIDFDKIWKASPPAISLRRTCRTRRLKVQSESRTFESRISNHQDLRRYELFNKNLCFSRPHADPHWQTASFLTPLIISICGVDLITWNPFHPVSLPSPWAAWC